VLTLLLAAAVLLFLDQWSKRVVRHRFAHRSVDLGRSVRIRRVITVKAIYQRWGVRVALVLVWFVALACTAALHVSGATLQSLPSLWGVGAALGGAAGNLVDILRRQAVVDFIDLGWWPAFNVADVGIVGGLTVVLWPYVWRLL
jgi:signal peptidase II